MIHQGDRPVAFFPFQFESNLFKCLQSAVRLGGESSDYCGVVAEPGFYTNPREILRFAFLKTFYFTHLDATQMEFGLTGEKPEIGLRIRLGSEGGDYIGKIKERHPKFLSETVRLAKRFEKEHGEFRFTFLERKWEKPLRHLLTEKRRQYSRTDVPDPLADKRKIRLLERLASSDIKRCRGVISTLYAGSTWVSSHFGLRNQGTLHYWFPVYNHELGRFPSGHFLLLKIISCSLEEGITKIDRGCGDTPAKRLFSNEEHFFYRGLWAARGIRSCISQKIYSFKWRMGI